MLNRCAPYVVIFNEKNLCITVQSESTGRITYKVSERCAAEDRPQPHKVVVAKVVDETETTREYYVAQAAMCAAGVQDKVQVAIPTEFNGNHIECRTINEIPKLFLSFPIIGTENFCFPAVINSRLFTPHKDRDGVVIGQNNTPENRTNNEVIEKSCSLVVNLVKFAASSGWRKIYEIATIPSIPRHNWLDVEWIRGRIKALFLDVLRKTPMVINECGGRIDPNDLKLPYVSNDEHLHSFLDILAEWRDYENLLPCRDEAGGWLRAANSWAEMLDIDVRELSEIFDGNRMAKDIDKVSNDPDTEVRTHRIDRLHVIEDTDKVDWINRFISFLINDGLRDAITKWRVIPSQAGFLRTVDTLYRDDGVDDELKNIADLITPGWAGLDRRELRSVKIGSLADETGKGDWNNDSAVDYMIRKLSDVDEQYLKPSAELFAWITNQGHWARLTGLRMFSENYTEANQEVTRAVLKLDGTNDVLAPVKSWDQELQQYAVLFPMRHTLASEYFKAVHDPAIWSGLEQRELVIRDVILKREDCHVRFVRDEFDEHVANQPVSVTNIAFWPRVESESWSECVAAVNLLGNYGNS